MTWNKGKTEYCDKTNHAPRYCKKEDLVSGFQSLHNQAKFTTLKCLGPGNTVITNNAIIYPESDTEWIRNIHGYNRADRLWKIAGIVFIVALVIGLFIYSIGGLWNVNLS